MLQSVNIIADTQCNILPHLGIVMNINSKPAQGTSLECLDCAMGPLLHNKVCLSNRAGIMGFDFNFCSHLLSSHPFTPILSYLKHWEWLKFLHVEYLLYCHAHEGIKKHLCEYISIYLYIDI